MKISELCYELYKVDWKKHHVSSDMEMDNIKDWYEGLVDDVNDYAYDEYIFEFGYNGELYACYDEFCEAEYLDDVYMRNLLDNEKLFEAYLADVEQR